jgi:hypothetical protein
MIMLETLEWQGQAPLTLMLVPRTVLHLSAGKCRHIECRTGRLWLSDAPAGADHVLAAGQALQVSSDVVLSGLPWATIAVSHCHPSTATGR